MSEALFMAIQAKDAAGVARLLTEGADPNAVIGGGERFPVLVYAADTDEAEIVELLLDAGANIDARGVWDRISMFHDDYYEEAQENALERAAMFDRRKAAAVLVKR